MYGYNGKVKTSVTVP